MRMYVQITRNTILGTTDDAVRYIVKCEKTYPRWISISRHMKETKEGDS
jgi:hypothetical protein